MTTEQVEKRTATTKTFNTDQPGVQRTDVFGAPVHFKDSRGSWAEIDATLVTRDGHVEPSGSPTPVRVVSNLRAEEVASITLPGGHTVSYGLEGALPVAATVDGAEHEVRFEGALEGVDLKLEIGPMGLKEDLIVRAADDMPESFRFPLTTGGLTPTLTVRGDVELADNSGLVRGVIPHGSMRDSAGGEQSHRSAVSHEVAYSLQRAGDGWTLTVTPDPGWVHAPERVWPVVVDPSFTQVGADTDDTFVTNGSPGDNSALLNLDAGYATAENRAFVHFSGLDALAGKIVLYSEMKFYEYGSGSCTPTWLDIYRVTEPWSTPPTSWPGPASGDLVNSINTAKGYSSACASDWLVLNSTRAVERWLDGTWPNHGVMLRARDETDPNAWKRLGSSTTWVPPHVHVYWSDPSPGNQPVVSKLTPMGDLQTLTPNLSARYTDPNGDSGAVVFTVLDKQTQLVIAAGTGTTVASGDTSTWTVPTGTLQWGREYATAAIAYDSTGVTSPHSQPIPLSTNVGRLPSASDGADPFIFREGNTFYAFATQFGATRIPYRTSTDLQNWSAQSEAIGAQAPWMNAGFPIMWAPTVGKFGSTHVMYHSGFYEAGGRHCITPALSSDGPDGPYNDTDNGGSPTFLCPPDGAIDPDLFTHAGITYLLWKTDGNGAGNDTLLYARALDSTGLAFASGSAPILLLKQDQAWENGGPGFNLVEQPAMTEVGGQIRLFYAGNKFESNNYAIGYATCPTFPTPGPPSVPICTKQTTDSTGPWLSGTSSGRSASMNWTVKTNGPGAASFFTDLAGNTWIAYHGYADTPCDLCPRSMYIEKVDLYPATPRIQGRYPYQAAVVTDLGSLGGSVASAFGINNASQVVGNSAVSGDAQIHSWYWEPSSTNLADKSLYDLSRPNASVLDINNPGQYVGVQGLTINSLSCTNYPDAQAAFWDANDNYYTQLGTLGGNDSCAQGVNDDGQAVGVSFTSGGFGSGIWQSFVWDPVGLGGGPHQLLGTCLCYSFAYKINNNSRAVGYLYGSVSGYKTQAFYVDVGSTGTLIPMPPGADSTYALDINDSGLIVGQADYPAASGTPPSAWVYDSTTGVLTDLSTLSPGFRAEAAWGINETGQVVGYGHDSGGGLHGFIWHPAYGVLPLTVPSSFGNVIYDINDDGVLVGFSYPTASSTRALMFSAPHP